MSDLESKDPEAFYKEFWSSELWGSIEPNFDEKYRLAAIMQLFQENVLNKSNQDTSRKILDLGCGRGWLSHILSKHGEVTGIDVVKAAIDRAKELFPDVNFQKMESTELIDQGHSGQFDFIVSSEVIEHIDDEHKEVFVRSIYTLLKPGAYAVLTTPRGELLKAWKNSQRNEQPLEAWITERKLNQLVRSAKFKIIKRSRVKVNTYSLLGKLIKTRFFTKLHKMQPSSYVLGKIVHMAKVYQILLIQRSE